MKQEKVMGQSIAVKPIKPSETYDWLLKKHYARRICPISYAFGAYFGDDLVGIITYGVPASSTLRAGICGHEYSSYVIELNRLCCNSQKNLASILISRSIKMLPKPSIIVSFADTEQGHIGYVYQATNFIYTGLSAKRTDWKISGLEHLHGATISDMSRGKENRAQYLRDTYGDRFYLKDRSRKHRYIYLYGSKKQVSDMRAMLRYPSIDYPKGESSRYDASANVSTQIAMF